ncbi:MAG: hypothetical protein C4324_01645 [Blastocatellia bacterium]
MDADFARRALRKVLLVNRRIPQAFNRADTIDKQSKKFFNLLGSSHNFLCQYPRENASYLVTSFPMNSGRPVG